MGSIEFLDFFLGVIEDHDFEWPQHAHNPRHLLVQVVADRELQLFHVDSTVDPGHTDHVAERANGLGRHPPPSQSGDCRQAGVVPAIHETLLH